MTRFIRFLAPLAALLCTGPAAQARPIEFTQTLPKTTMPLRAGETANPIQGWVEFCAREPAECALDTREPDRIALDARTWDLLQRVNHQVNTTIEPITDWEHLHVVDRWDIPSDGKGDCEDFQLLKRKILVQRGLPRRVLRMAVVVDELGEGHAVLIARTDRGDLVLDNKLNLILSWELTGYQMVKMESQVAHGWVRIGPATSPVATAQP